MTISNPFKFLVIILAFAGGTCFAALALAAAAALLPWGLTALVGVTLVPLAYLAGMIYVCFWFIQGRFRILMTFLALVGSIALSVTLLAAAIVLLGWIRYAAAIPLLLVIVAFYGWVLYAHVHYRDGRRQEFLHFLVATVEAEAPLAPAVEAYLNDRPRGPLREFFVFVVLLALPGYYWLWHLRNSFDRKIETMAAMLRQGYSVPEVLHAVPGLTSRETVLLAELGQATDQLARCLRHSTQERFAAIWVEAVPRLLYPFLVLGCLGGLMTFWMTFIFPKFQRIFLEFNTELPETTRQLAEFCDVFADHAWLVPVVFLAGLAALSLLLVNATARWYCPGVGRLYCRHVQGQVLRLLGLLLDAGKPVPEALGVLAESTYFPRVARGRLGDVRFDVEQGGALAPSLREAGLLPETMMPLVQAAERVRNLPWALTQIGEHLSDRTILAVRRLSMLIAPVMVVAVGLLVGFGVLGMFMPLVEILMRFQE